MTKPLSKKSKALIQIGLTVTLFVSSTFTYIPVLNLLDSLFYLDFNHLMFLAGLTLGLCYYALSLGAYFLRKKAELGPGITYFLTILPNSFVLNCFLWYFILFFNRVFSESKDDSQYFQTLIIAFSIYFLTVKISKEVVNLWKFYQKD